MRDLTPGRMYRLVNGPDGFGLARYWSRGHAVQSDGDVLLILGPVPDIDDEPWRPRTLMLHRGELVWQFTHVILKTQRLRDI